MYRMPSSTCQTNPPHPLVQKAWPISKAPVKMDTQPMNMVLITVTSMTSPSTKKPARIMTSPSRTQTQKDGVGSLVTSIGELLSYVVMSYLSVPKPSSQLAHASGWQASDQPFPAA